MAGRIIDAHLHLSERKEDILVPYAKANGLEYTLDDLLKTMRRNRIGQGLLLSSRMKNGTILPNIEVFKLCEKSRGMLWPVLTVEPSVKEVAGAVGLARNDRKIVKGFKIMLGYARARADSPVYNELYDYAESEKLPVLFHTGDTASETGTLANSHPLALDELANKRRELTIVLCHFGNPWIMDAAELVYKHPNVYADTSGLVTGKGKYPRPYAAWLARTISEAIYFIGDAEKVFFGTDYPVSKHADALALVRKLDVSARDRENILWRNAERVFNI